jgi:small subunit ribosomal protein S7
MPRKARSYDKHVPLPDPKFGSVKYAKFINYLMQRGKKSVAQKIFYNALEIVTEKMSAATPSSAVSAKTSPDKPGDNQPQKKLDGRPSTSSVQPVSENKKIDGRQVFDQALKNVAPIMELKSRRIGGANYQVPMEVPEPRKTSLGMKWMIAAAQGRKGVPMREKLAAEIMDAYNKQGAAVKKREDVHRMAEANKAFAHFARFGRR